jgi:hypothetical protein
MRFLSSKVHPAGEVAVDPGMVYQEMPPYKQGN